MRRLKEAGADCLKILLYYTPFDPKDVNDKKHAWVERIGDECRANDIPFFLEFVGYEEGADEKGLDYAKKKPKIVAASMKEFSKDRYGVDVLKVEVPINMKYVDGTKAFGGQKAYSKMEAMGLFLEAATATTKPFIYLSAGVSNAEFTEALELAAESGVKFNGVLCGRATWKEGIPVYAKQGAGAFREWLESEGVKNINNVNDRLKAATSWYSDLRGRAGDGGRVVLKAEYKGASARGAPFFLNPSAASPAHTAVRSLRGLKGIQDGRPGDALTTTAPTALITGASSGIGYELAKLFAKDHHNLVLVARNGPRLEQVGNELQRQFGITVRTVALDLAAPTAPAVSVRGVAARWG